MNLSPLPLQKFFDNNGIPLAGGQLFTYVAGTTTKLATYKDQAGTLNTNPIVLDYRGEANVWMDPTLAYKFTLAPAGDTDPPTRPIWTVDNISAALTTINITQAFLGAILFPRTSAEITAGVTPVFYYYLPGDVRRYGAVLDNTTDDSVAIQNWLSVGGDLFFPVAATGKVTVQLNLVSNCTIRFAKGGGLSMATANLSMLKGSSKTKIKINGGTFTQGGTGATGDIGLVHLLSCDNCEVSENTFVNAQWAGVHLDNSTDCDVYWNTFTGTSTGTNPSGDMNDIAVYRNSSNCRVAFNRCYTVNCFGIIVQDPGGAGAFLPQKNKVHNNWVKTKSAHGIIVYIGAATFANSYNQVFENDVQDVSGSAGTTIFGAGIYVVGFGAGGTKVVGNNVRNCCSSTTGIVNNQAGITINGLAANGEPVVVADNTVSGQTKFASICIATNLGCQVICSNNGIDHPTGNTTGDALFLQDSNNTTLSSNRINVSTASGRRGIRLSATIANINITVDGNSITGGGDRQIETTIGGGSFAQLVVNNNVLRGAPAGVIPLVLATCDELVVNGNSVNSNNTYALLVTACTRARIDGNTLRTGGTISFGTSGVCTGSYFGESNYINGVVENAGTGLLANYFGSVNPPGAPTQGAVGDRVIQSVPVVGNFKGLRCTVAGTPGTWVSEGNL